MEPHARAMFNVAVCLQKGRGAPINEGMAAEWYSKAEEHGFCAQDLQKIVADLTQASVIQPPSVSVGRGEGNTEKMLIFHSNSLSCSLCQLQRLRALTEEGVVALLSDKGFGVYCDFVTEHRVNGAVLEVLHVEDLVAYGVPQHVAQAIIELRNAQK
jgi:hypothetical protein